MAATRADLAAWFDRGVAEGATHVVVVTDEFDWDDFPVFVLSEEDVREIVADQVAKPMQRVMEVYNLAMDKDAQLAEHRAFHYDVE